MSRLLVFGNGPLADGHVRYLDNRGLRTWQIARPLIDDGHDVMLVVMPPCESESGACELLTREYGETVYEALGCRDRQFILNRLGLLGEDFRPDALIAVGHEPAALAARLSLRKPLWVDLHRYAMSTCQGQSARQGDDSILREAWRREALALRRADKCSAVSRPQLYALLGEMARLGRFNSQTHDHQFVHHLPDAFHPAFTQPLDPKTRPVVRGTDVPADAFIVLWSGGYNDWTDADFLFECIEGAMNAAPEIHYVSTGGAIPDFNDLTYSRFQDLVEKSAHRERYHLLGWLPFERVVAIHGEADLGICLDTPNYETFFGARNRLTNMLAAGLPVLTTWGTEISATVDETHCGIVAPPGDSRVVVRGILDLLRAPQQCRKLGDYARQIAAEAFDAYSLSAALRQWAATPSFAPDNAAKLRRDPNAESVGAVALNHLDHIAQVAEKRDWAEITQDYAELKDLQSRWWFKTAGGLKKTAQAAHRLVRKIRR